MLRDLRRLNKIHLPVFALIAALSLALPACVTKDIKPAFRSTAAAGAEPPPPYLLFTPSLPSGDAGTKRPLIVVLHGCLQDADAIQKIARLDEIAAQGGYYVLYPNQTPGKHPLNCWNWFDPASQKRDSGELADVMKIIGEVESKNPIDPKQVYIAGLSSGAALASTLLACYPNSFAGGALISSPAYGVAVSEQEAQKAIAEPINKNKLHRLPCSPQHFRGRVLIEVGTNDRVVQPTHAALLSEQFATPRERNAVSSPTWHLNDPGSLLFITTCFGAKNRICRVTVDRMDHAWSGGRLAAFSEPRGPSTAEMIKTFLIEKR